MFQQTNPNQPLSFDPGRLISLSLSLRSCSLLVGCQFAPQDVSGVPIWDHETPNLGFPIGVNMNIGNTWNICYWMRQILRTSVSLSLSLARARARSLCLSIPLSRARSLSLSRERERERENCLKSLKLFERTHSILRCKDCVKLHI